jgi:hypothetical protein
MLGAGFNLKIASKRLGHANIAVTGDFYQHVSIDMQRDVARKMGKLLTLESPKTPIKALPSGRKSGRLDKARQSRVKKAP